MQNKWTKTWIVLGILFGQIGLFQLLFSIQSVNDFIVNQITFPLSSSIAKMTNSVHFPIGELFYLFIGLLGLTLIIRIGFTLIKDKKKLHQSIFSGLVFINLCYGIYMMFWGVMYQKETLVFDRKEIHIETKILKEIYCKDLEKAIYYRNQFSQNDDKPLQFHSNLEEYNREFFQLQHELEKLEWLKNYQLLKQVHYKISTISMLQNYMGILGYYNPFTAEANLNDYNTPLKKASTLFHEYGHQMGFASESEANFLAYYLGSQSNNREINYSVYYKSIYSLLGAIYKSDPYFVQMEMEKMNTSIKRDRKAELNYYTKYDGKASDAFSELNNQFLKANQQEGTISYSKYVELIYYLYQTKKRNH